MSCRPKNCGAYYLIKEQIGLVLESFEINQTNFVGLDISTKFTGISVCSIKNKKLVVKMVELVEMQSKNKQNDQDPIFARYNQYYDKFTDLRKQNPTSNSWEILSEDLIFRHSFGKGVIGSHSIQETITACRLAAHHVFGTIPRRVNVRTARAGLGLNLTGSKSGREATKEAVVLFAQKFAPSHAFIGKGADDRADSLVLAIMAVRLALQRELLETSEIIEHIESCHGPDIISTTQKVQKLIDELWVIPNFPTL